MRLDPFTVGIIRDGLVAAAEESFIRFGRSSQSPIIYEVLDYAAGITDERGDLVAQANGVPGFLGTLSFAVKAVIEKFGGAGPKPGEGFAPGDLFITNDPYSGGGNHLSDVALIQPIFCGRKSGGRSRAGSNGQGPSAKGARPVAFSVNKAHWTEVGGMAPGSWTTDSTEIYQEGLQFPVIRLGAGYTPDPALVDLIAANVRTPERTLGDLLAGIAALRTAERRVMEIAAKFGERVVRESMNTILDDGERSARAALSSLPRGTFRADELMDDDGLSDEPVRVQAKVTITGDEFVADFTGSSPQVRGPINCTRTRLHSACRSMFKSVTDPGAPLNDGWFRPLRVVCPDGTVFTASRPAPVSTYWETGAYAVDLIWKALFPVLPGRLTAGHFLSICGIIISGADERGERFILVAPQAGGVGRGRGQGRGERACRGGGRRDLHHARRGVRKQVPTPRRPVRIRGDRQREGQAPGGIRGREGLQDTLRRGVRDRHLRETQVPPVGFRRGGGWVPKRSRGVSRREGAWFGMGKLEPMGLGRRGLEGEARALPAAEG